MPIRHNLCMGSNEKSALDPLAIECGRRIRECRGELTQREIALATGWSEETPQQGLSPNRIAMYERGERLVDLDAAKLLSKAFPTLAPPYFQGSIDEQEAAMLMVLRNQKLEQAQRRI